MVKLFYCFSLPFLSLCSILAPRAISTDTSSSWPPAHARVRAVSWLLSVFTVGKKKKQIFRNWKYFKRTLTFLRQYYIKFSLSELIRKQIHSKPIAITHMCIDVNWRIHREHRLRGHIARCLWTRLRCRGFGSVRGAGGATGHSAIHSWKVTPCY